MTATPTLQRQTFTTSRLMDFFSRKELVAQTGHRVEDWPLVVVKELVDNALDGCEEADVAPDIHITVDDRGITVADNGPGIPPATVEGILDFSVRVSSREAYVAPDRGAQGNALKTVAAMPFVLDGRRGVVDIVSRGVRHRVNVTVDPVEQTPVIDHTRDPADVTTGTVVTVGWPDSASPILHAARHQFLQVADVGYPLLNPHAAVSVDWHGDHHAAAASDRGWSKWTPNAATSAHWYQLDDLARLVAAYVAHDRRDGSDRSVREFVTEFRGLTGSAKAKRVLDATGLARTSLSDLANGRLDTDTIGGLLDAMREHSKPVNAAALGVIGRTHLEQRFVDLGCHPDSIAYRKATGDTDGVPWVVEVAFGWCPDLDGRGMVTGVNWSPALINPFRQLGWSSLDSVLEAQRAGRLEPVVLAVHLASPRVAYTDRGKSAVVLDHEQAEAVHDAVESATRKWAKQRKAEERRQAAAWRRRDAMTRRRRTTIKDAAWQVMQRAYVDAQGRPGLPANARQIFYKARPEILRLTGKDRLDSAYFTQTLLPDYVNEHPDETDGWDVVYDARGHLREPHTGVSVALGTIEVRRYVARFDRTAAGDAVGRLGLDYPTSGPGSRYSSVLFMEKEGFDELLVSARFAERYDLAVMSTKGLSVIAARKLVDALAGRGVRLFVAHDFDKAGFSILATLTGDSDRYQFRHDVDVVDLGIRLEDVQTHGLEGEDVSYGNMAPEAVKANLADNGATDAEVEFLVDDGRRVELNAFSSDLLVTWLETKLDEHGVGKVVPDDDTLAAAYRRAVKRQAINDAIRDAEAAADETADHAEIPDDLNGRVRDALAADPQIPWDQALADIVTSSGGAA